MVPAWLLLLLAFSGRGFTMYLDDAYEVPEPGTHYTSSCENDIIHCKKKVTDFPVPSRDVTIQTLPGWEKLNYSRLGRVR